MLDILGLVLLVLMCIEFFSLIFIYSLHGFYMWVIALLLTFTVFIVTYTLDGVVKEHRMIYKEYYDQNPD
jgi:hypothetical protein